MQPAGARRLRQPWLLFTGARPPLPVPRCTELAGRGRWARHMSRAASPDRLLEGAATRRREMRKRSTAIGACCCAWSRAPFSCRSALDVILEYVIAGRTSKHEQSVAPESVSRDPCRASSHCWPQRQVDVVVSPVSQTRSETEIAAECNRYDEAAVRNATAVVVRYVRLLVAGKDSLTCTRREALSRAGEYVP